METKNETKVSAEQIENTRKIGESLQSEILRRIADVTQVRAAASMGVSGSTVSRMCEDLGKFAHLLAAIGLKVADVNSIVVDQSEMEALESMAFKYLDRQRREKQARRRAIAQVADADQKVATE